MLLGTLHQVDGYTRRVPAFERALIAPTSALTLLPLALAITQPVRRSERNQIRGARQAPTTTAGVLSSGRMANTSCEMK